MMMRGLLSELGVTYGRKGEERWEALKGWCPSSMFAHDIATSGRPVAFLPLLLAYPTPLLVPRPQRVMTDLAFGGKAWAFL